MALIPQPPNLKEVLIEVQTQTAQIRRKTNTLIDYYVYPEKTPNEIKDYDPRLAILELRAKSLAKISVPHLRRLVDHAEPRMARSINEIIDQLLNAVHGIRTIFEERYDQALIKRQPFGTIYGLLDFREKELTAFIEFETRNPQFRRPESIPSSESLYFCPGAVQMINRRDAGRIQAVKERDLLDTNRTVKQQFGGDYLWWECSSDACTFKCRFHVLDSNNLNINTVQEIREHASIPAIEYRSAFLAKSHLFLPAPPVLDSVDSRRARPRSARSVSSSGLALPFYEPIRYGCVFCFAEGKALERERTAFETAKELAYHLVQRHKGSLPPNIMVTKFAVAIKGRSAEGVRRWDVNFK